MPKAFTHLCKNVNISLFDDTLTVYPKSVQPLIPRNETELLFMMLFGQMDCNSMKVGQFFAERNDELGVYRFVHREDHDHARYHQDGFDTEDQHYHANFRQTITERKLDSILSILVRYSIIDSTEHASFMKAYKEATAYKKPSATVSELSFLSTGKNTSPSGESVASVDKKNEDETESFAGFKRGFLL